MLGKCLVAAPFPQPTFARWMMVEIISVRAIMTCITQIFRSLPVGSAAILAATSGGGWRSFCANNLPISSVAVATSTRGQRKRQSPRDSAANAHHPSADPSPQQVDSELFPLAVQRRLQLQPLAIRQLL